MFQYIIIAFLIVLIICLIYRYFFQNTSDKIRNNAAELLDKSSGGNDHAEVARAALLNIPDPTPNDRYRRARILQHNILDNNLRGQGDAVRDITVDFTGAVLDMQPDDPAADNMLQGIEDFYLLTADEIFEDEIARNIWTLGEILNDRAPAIRQEVITNRVNQAKSEALNREEAISRALDDATQYRDDRQNVHDRRVGSDLNIVLRRLKATAPDDFDPKSSLEDIRKHIGKHARAGDATTTFDRMARGDTISTFNETEDRILAYTWERCNHPQNKPRADLMRAAVITALADGVENGHPVCANGRCGQVLNSLVTLDYDEDVSTGAMTFEAYRNQIFQETKAIIQQKIDMAKSSTDNELKQVGAAYETGEELDTPAEVQFKTEIKQSIDKNIETYKGRLTDAEMNGIKQECYIYGTV